MDRYIPLTENDLISPSPPIDTLAPRDVLQARADYRVHTVNQMLENIAYRAEIGSDTVVLSNFSKLLADSLRDGCDLFEVTRGRKQLSDESSG